MTDLSVIIPGRHEIFMQQTCMDVLSNMRGDTEVIAVCDGYWPDPPIQDHPRLNVIHFTEPVGQRAATNAGARLSQAKYIMKLDAHCAVSEGFDVALMEDAQPDWCMVPTMHNLHAFNWVCNACQHTTYQGVEPVKCEKCGAQQGHTMDIVWKPREGRETISWRFDRNLHFQYWRRHAKRQEARGDLVETMSFIGACMFLPRDMYWRLGGMDEGHGSWGQFGTEWACKAWLSGGKLITSRKCWFAHMFRTGNFAKNGHSSWPYPISQKDIDAARAYSQRLWLEDRWPLATRKLQWLVDHFAPVPDWHEGAK